MRNTASPLFKGALVCDENFSITFWKKKQLQLNKNQWAVGFTILEASKLIMQKLYYETIQPRFGIDNVEVLMSDTDSFLLKLRTNLSGDECVQQMYDVMDTSNYPPSHPLYSRDKEKALGFLKDEVPNKKILSFVGLKSKTYAIQVEGGKTEVKAKGIPHHAKKKIPMEAMRQCLYKVSSFSSQFNTLRAKDHVNSLVQSSRIAFSSFDDKRYALCTQHSVPYGSVLIPTDGSNYCCFCYELQKLPQPLAQPPLPPPPPPGFHHLWTQQQHQQQQQQQQQQQHRQVNATVDSVSQFFQNYLSSNQQFDFHC